MRLAAALIALLMTVTGALAQSEHSHAKHDANAPYKAADFDVAMWLDRLENPERDVIAHKAGVLEALGIEPGDHVADVGAGTGAYMEGISKLVGASGRYYGVDITPGFVDYMRGRAHEAGLDNVTLVLSRETSATLPTASMDKIVVINTYHHFGDLDPMLASLGDALKPGGTLIIVEFDRIEGKSRQWVLDHIRADKATFRAEIEAAGFRFVEETTDSGLEENFILKFTKG